MVERSLTYQTRRGTEFSAYDDISVFPTARSITDPLVAAIRDEYARETSGEGDCEDSTLVTLTGNTTNTQKQETSPAQEKRKIRAKAAKKVQKARKKQVSSLYTYKLREAWVKKFTCPQRITTVMNAEDLPAASNAWIGTQTPVEETHSNVQELMAQGYHYVEWNGS